MNKEENIISDQIHDVIEETIQNNVDSDGPRPIKFIEEPIEGKLNEVIEEAEPINQEENAEVESSNFIVEEATEEIIETPENIEDNSEETVVEETTEIVPENEVSEIESSDLTVEEEQPVEESTEEEVVEVPENNEDNLEEKVTEEPTEITSENEVSEVEPSDLIVEEEQPVEESTEEEVAEVSENNEDNLEETVVEETTEIVPENEVSEIESSDLTVEEEQPLKESSEEEIIEASENNEIQPEPVEIVEENTIASETEFSYNSNEFIIPESSTYEVTVENVEEPQSTVEEEIINNSENNEVQSEEIVNEEQIEIVLEEANVVVENEVSIPEVIENTPVIAEEINQIVEQPLMEEPIPAIIDNNIPQPMPTEIAVTPISNMEAIENSNIVNEYDMPMPIPLDNIIAPIPTDLGYMQNIVSDQTVVVAPVVNSLDNGMMQQPVQNNLAGVPVIAPLEQPISAVAPTPIPVVQQPLIDNNQPMQSPYGMSLDQPQMLNTVQPIMQMPMAVNAEQPKKSKKIFIIIFVLLIVVAGAVYFILNKDKKETEKPSNSSSNSDSNSGSNSNSNSNGNTGSGYEWDPSTSKIVEIKDPDAVKLICKTSSEYDSLKEESTVTYIYKEDIFLQAIIEEELFFTEASMNFYNYYLGQAEEDLKSEEGTYDNLIAEIRKKAYSISYVYSIDMSADPTNPKNLLDSSEMTYTEAKTQLESEGYTCK
jgi:AAA ATPase containing von Willebrand factor type A (vWA) domain